MTLLLEDTGSRQKVGNAIPASSALLQKDMRGPSQDRKLGGRLRVESPGRDHVATEVREIMLVLEDTGTR